ncbi:autotransporter assembly complex family protein [Arenibaculum sp.]|uniref:autotransporter assembly complex protein TamA n=1 Tax=Arenibaculum sp. TaxID=2865862 RepID=UPI002E1531BE|nr:autotransporter assembly complex family protein [Arenibaculum sp.]
MDLTGIDDSELRELIEEASSLFSLADDPPPSLVGLQRRIEADRGRVEAALRSVGYYAGTVDVAVDSAADPIEVRIAVEPGPRYTFGEVAVVGPEGRPLEEVTVERDALALPQGAPALARDVVAAQSRLEELVVARGYAFAEVPDREIVVDHSDRTMDVTFVVAPGDAVLLGPVTIRGLERVDEDLVRGRIPWDPGARFRPELLARARERISDLGPFASVRVDLAEETGADGLTPVVVEVVERPRRVIGAAVAFSTTEGLGVEAFWGHRNLFGGGEQFDISGFASGIGVDSVSADVVEETDFGIDVEFRKPDVFAVDQTLIASLELLTERPEAYDREAVTASVRLSRVLSGGLTAGYGVTVERSRIQEAERSTTSTLFGVPLSVAWDVTDDLLDPSEGVRTELLTTPWVQSGAADARFLASRWTTSAYQSFLEDDLTLAGRVSFGSIAGAEVEEIPADKRFYAGGGGSIRGFGFQRVGPADAFGDPRGGRSLFEIGAELRYRLTDTIGIVPFVDGGNVFDTTLPSFDEELKWGAGLGLRYFTGFGPLRADVAVPLNPEPGDDRWALYLSIGQAF